MEEQREREREEEQTFQSEHKKGKWLKKEHPKSTHLSGGVLCDEDDEVNDVQANYNNLYSVNQKQKQSQPTERETEQGFNSV